MDIESIFLAERYGSYYFEIILTYLSWMIEFRILIVDAIIKFSKVVSSPFKSRDTPGLQKWACKISAKDV